MKFWIDNSAGDNYETFETKGLTSSNLSAHLDAMKIASFSGYGEDYTLQTEDGFIYQIVNPLIDVSWENQLSFDSGALIERAS